MPVGEIKKSDQHALRNTGQMKPCFPTGTVGPRVGISLSPLDTNDGLSLSTINARAEMEKSPFSSDFFYFYIPQFEI